MNGFLYTVTLEEPVLANSLGGEPNSARSLFYIPGGLVRGAVINWLGEQDADDNDFRSRFLTGETRFLNAYPLMEDGRRALPIPLKYKKPKYTDTGDFGRRNDTKIDALEEEWQINIHTQRDPKKGRSTRDIGAVYRYIALPAGMQFQGAVVSSKDTGAIRKVIDENKSILLGKARTAGYGKASIVTKDLPEDDDWRKVGEAIKKNTKEFTLVLLSPALVRNKDGQFTLDISTALSKRLDKGHKITKIESTCQPEIIGGFNRKWGLPLPQTTAIATGSVFVVTLENEIAPNEIKDLEDMGIGERRAEGFGSLAIVESLPDPENFTDDDWNPLTVTKTDQAESSSSADGLTEEDNQLADMMLARLLRRDLDQLIVTKAREMMKDYKKDAVPNSQLSRWRVLLRDSIAKQGTEVEENGVKKKFNPITRMENFRAAESAKSSSAWGKMQKARITVEEKPNRLTDWIEASLTHPESINNLFEFTRKTKIGGRSAALDEALRVEYRLRLMEAVFAMMSKINSGEGGKNGKS